MKKLLYGSRCRHNCRQLLTVAVSADDGRTLTVVSVTEKSITFKYTGAKAGDNNWSVSTRKPQKYLLKITPRFPSSTFISQTATVNTPLTSQSATALAETLRTNTLPALSGPISTPTSAFSRAEPKTTNSFGLAELPGTIPWQRQRFPQLLRAAEITPPPPTALLQSLSSQLQQQVLLFSQRKSTDRQIRAEMPRIIRTV